jgi:hypothetical protein
MDDEKSDRRAEVLRAVAAQFAAAFAFVAGLV